MGKHQWQHYLPRVCWAGFATASGEVWRYDRVSEALKLLAPPVIGAEKDLYSLITGEVLYLTARFVLAIGLYWDRRRLARSPDYEKSSFHFTSRIDRRTIMLHSSGTIAQRSCILGFLNNVGEYAAERWTLLPLPLN